jgi:hypothetical protein
VSLGTGGGAMPRADGSELRLRATTADVKVVRAANDAGATGRHSSAWDVAQAGDWHRVELGYAALLLGGRKAPTSGPGHEGNTSDRWAPRISVLFHFQKFPKTDLCTRKIDRK